jgi:hypothetical protein
MGLFKDFKKKPFLKKNKSFRDSNLFRDCLGIYNIPELKSFDHAKDKPGLRYTLRILEPENIPYIPIIKPDSAIAYRMPVFKFNE